ncbi:hypothetical protein [Flavivirga jejuensis]|uniref:Uncharacterized protein n=1 Tax=Flavivirga jejuensis TaxID=870487 RepID=A0ABT8WP56_9FLAO|nr:hypothetical protein [Flavivirga jejuensis]MDO5974918.1 hypothetical protein [Flavivirga jejuensis]
MKCLRDMYERVEKFKENKSGAVANSVAQKKNNKNQGVKFLDNCPEAKQANQLQILVSNTTQLKQMAKWQNGNVSFTDNIIQRVWANVNSTVSWHVYTSADFPNIHISVDTNNPENYHATNIHNHLHFGRDGVARQGNAALRGDINEKQKLGVALQNFQVWYNEFRRTGTNIY